MRKKFIAGNWKMFKGGAEAGVFAGVLKKHLEGNSSVQVAVAPPFTALNDVIRELAGTNIEVAAQDCYWEPEGAFTGEVSAKMLKEVGVKHVIIAHSERRQYFGETNETANKKAKAALAEGLGVILCIGETLEEREKGKTMDVVYNHLKGGLDGLTPEQMNHVVIAYEPVWAIGTGKTATPAEAQEVHAFIRKILGETLGAGTAAATRIQYGGSVKPENVKELMAQPDIDGALVGGASLKVDSFEKLVKFNG